MRACSLHFLVSCVALAAAACSNPPHLTTVLPACLFLCFGKLTTVDVQLAPPVVESAP